MTSTDPTQPAVAHSGRRTIGRRRAAGFTLIEMLAALSVAGVLSSVAYPTYTGQVQKARRSDALVSLMQIQLAEERWRSNSASYGTLAQIAMPSATLSGAYTLEVRNADADGFQVMATAAGAQAADRSCRYLLLTVAGASVVQASGPDAEAANGAAANRKCWNL